MKKLISTLYERIVLLEKNEDITSTTAKMYNDIINTRANISPDQLNKSQYNVIFPKPPPSFRYKRISAIRWNGNEYKLTSKLMPFNNIFFKGIFEKSF